MFTPQNIGAAGSILSGVTDLANLGMSLNAYGYQKKLQKNIFQREDNAVQRRVNDLRQAGLSPVLAAGSAAGAGGIVSVNAPQLGDMTDKLSLAYDLATQKKNLDRTDADIERTKADTLKVMKELEVLDTTQKYIKTQTNGQFIKNQKDARDLKLMLLTGFGSNGGTWSNLIRDFSGAVYNAAGVLDDDKNVTPKKKSNGKIDKSGRKENENIRDYINRVGGK